MNATYGDWSGRYITTGKNNLCIGIEANSAFDNCTVIGDHCVSIVNNEVVVGWELFGIRMNDEEHDWIVRIATLTRDFPPNQRLAALIIR